MGATGRVDFEGPGATAPADSVQPRAGKGCSSPGHIKELHQHFAPMGAVDGHQAGAAGQVEILCDITLLLRLESPEPLNTDAEEDSLMLGLFLHFLSRQALSSDQAPVLHTEAMAAEDDDLLAGVSVDAGQEAPRA